MRIVTLETKGKNYISDWLDTNKYAVVIDDNLVPILNDLQEYYFEYLDKENLQQYIKHFCYLTKLPLFEIEKIVEISSSVKTDSFNLIMNEYEHLF